MEQVESLPEHIRHRIPLLYTHSGIDYRYSCVEDYLRKPDSFDFFPATWSLQPAPSTGARNKKYREAVVPLATRVAQDALTQANRQPSEVTHVLAVSCTGFFAPGLDIELVKHLGLPATTQRTIIGFMGCYAAFNALRVAHSFCQSDPSACVLLVCAELCTLHFQTDDTLESAVVNALFSDGAAAAILSAQSPEAAPGHLAYMDNLCLLDEDSMDLMTWDIGDTGFSMGLSPRVPSVLAKHLPSYIHMLLSRHGLTPADLDFWALHPGGKAIIAKAQHILGLTDADVHDSLEVLRLFGNMSSPTILFVLQRFLERHSACERQGVPGFAHGVALAFGPGLTLEGCLFQRVP